MRDLGALAALVELAETLAGLLLGLVSVARDAHGLEVLEAVIVLVHDVVDLAGLANAEWATDLAAVVVAVQDLEPQLLPVAGQAFYTGLIPSHSSRVAQARAIMTDPRNYTASHSGLNAA